MINLRRTSIKYSYVILSCVLFGTYTAYLTHVESFDRTILTYIMNACAFLLTLVSVYVLGLAYRGNITITSHTDHVRILSSSTLPNPGKTMLKHVEKAGHLIGDISSIHLMVGESTSEYLRDFIKGLKARNNNVKITVFGCGDGDNSFGDDVIVHKAQKQLTEHSNIIRFKNSDTILNWFEPTHTVKCKNGKEYHSLPYGAFLLEITKEQAANLRKD